MAKNTVNGDTDMKETTATRPAEAPKPAPGLKPLNRLVGTWKITGDTKGELSYEWMKGGHFLIARGIVDQDGKITEHVEIIGYERPAGASKVADVLTSRHYTNHGDTLDYTHEVDDKTVTSWFGPKGSPAVMRARWVDEDTLTGGWEWPGGGYKLTLTRVTPRPSRPKE